MEGTEVRKLAALEDRHWWYAERRHLLARQLSGLPPGRALDIGAAGGGNTRVLRSRGWQAVALEYTAEGAEVAQERGLSVIRADATALPAADAAFDAVVAYDVLEHIPDDRGAVREIRRVLRPGGHLLVAVPVDMRLWSAHDVAVGHVRRYSKETIVELIAGAGFAVEQVMPWMVLLRPAVAWKRRSSTGSDLDEVPRWLNTGLHAVVTAERHLPLRRLPGVSVLVRARRR